MLCSYFDSSEEVQCPQINVPFVAGTSVLQPPIDMCIGHVRCSRVRACCRAQSSTLCELLPKPRFSCLHQCCWHDSAGIHGLHTAMHMPGTRPTPESAANKRILRAFVDSQE